MSIRDFIRENKNELDIAILRAMRDWKQGTTESVSGFKLNDREREMWILNDEGLYNWAKQCKVRV